jgi:hypothetical protein
MLYFGEGSEPEAICPEHRTMKWLRNGRLFIVKKRPICGSFFYSKKRNAYPCKKGMENIPLRGLCRNYNFATISKVVFGYICNHNG